MIKMSDKQMMIQQLYVFLGFLLIGEIISDEAYNHAMSYIHAHNNLISPLIESIDPSYYDSP
jgi:hypothetical protein